ncbi:hypothetical protein EYF80_029651 [Liparis tanakae]|uniref:Uncharacterized protein n=1 Tax=Liparis tanakae TaxID=230148 RepID=A0A4Z2H2V3_9TELE|nr:hypothetical protein EYF80_029651 [Liparis tanakae]
MKKRSGIRRQRLPNERQRKKEEDKDAADRRDCLQSSWCGEWIRKKEVQEEEETDIDGSGYRQSSLKAHRDSLRPETLRSSRSERLSVNQTSAPPAGPPDARRYITSSTLTPGI